MTSDWRQDRIEKALENAKAAVEFFDKVQASSSDERIAVGRDHVDWILTACRACGVLAKEST